MIISLDSFLEKPEVFVLRADALLASVGLALLGSEAEGPKVLEESSPIMWLRVRDSAVFVILSFPSFEDQAILSAEMGR